VEALESRMAQQGETVAAVLVEPVQGAGGVHPSPHGYLDAVRRLCDQYGAFLIFDEIVTGFGRLGSWFAAEHFKVEPDLVAFAKAVTSGYQPLGGVLVGPAVRMGLEFNGDFVLRHGFTYSGHPVACAAALTNLEIIRREQLLQRADYIGTKLTSGLRALADEHKIDHVRGAGAVWAAGLRPDQDAAEIRDRMLARGVICRASNASTLAFCPPLVISDAQIERIVEVLTDAVG